MKKIVFTFQPVQVNTVVVIHPGSLNLRIGRASDTFPVTIPHCIARKRKDNSIPEYRTPWMIRKEKEVIFNFRLKTNGGINTIQQ
jgi:actin-related protein